MKRQPMFKGPKMNLSCKGCSGRTIIELLRCYEQVSRLGIDQQIVYLDFKK